MKRFANQYGIELLPSESPLRGKLLIGATLFGTLRKEPPTKLDLLDTGMQILVTRPFGDLAPINVFLSCVCLLYTSPRPRDQRGSRMPSSA